MAIQKITADVISSDAITTASISDSAITAAKLAGTLDLTGKTITIATASSGDNDTSPASTAFVQQEISALVDSSPDALNTLNELAAALGDDANFSTTVTNSIALKAPLASPDFTGDATFDTTTLVVDATNNRVGIGTTSPDGNLEVRTNNAMTFGSDTVDSITLGTSGTNKPCIKFDTADTTHTNRVWAIENGAGNRLNFFRNGLDVLKLNQDGSVEIPGSIINSSAGATVATFEGNYSASGDVKLASFERNGGAVAAAITYADATTDMEFGTTTSHALSFTTGDTRRVIINSSGNVGIGTSNPQMGLHVGSGSQSTAALPGIGIANGGSSYSFYSASDGTKQYIAGIDHNITYTKAGSLSNHSHAIVSNNTIRLFCKTDGFLGIGDVDPDSTVHIKNSTAGGPQIHMDDGTNSAFINFDGTSMQLSTQRDMVDGTWHNTAKSWGGINIIGESIGSKITMQTAGNSNTSPTTHFLLDRDGHLILGSSTTAAGKLSVYTDATNDPAIYGYRSTSEFKIVPFLSNGAFSSLSNVNDSGLFFSDNFVIAKHATGYYGMIVTGDGSIHIGTESEATGSTGGVSFSADSSNRRNLICATTATGNLELIEFRNPNGTVGTIKSNGTSTSYNTSSDYRLKENVTYEFNALDRVTQLKPARFNFITDADTILDGFLAHEVSDIVPEAVSGEKDETKEKEVEVTPAQYEDDGETLISEAVMETRTVPVYQGIDHSKLVPLLTKAIQELKTELDAAKARIETLEG